MSHRLLIALLFGVFANGTVVTAQESADTLTVVYYVHERNTEQSAAVLERVTDNLDDHGITLSAIPGGDERSASQPAARISFFANRLYIYSAASPLSGVSPVLQEQDITFSLEPTKFAADMLTAFLLYVRGDCASAEPYWERIFGYTALYYDDTQILRLRGNCALIDGDYEAAVSIYESIEDLTHVDSESFNLAWAYFELGQEAEAFAIANTLVLWYVSQTAEQVDALTRRSQLYALDFQFDNAIADMTTAIELAKANPDTTPETLAHLYTERGQRILLLYEWDRVLVDYDQAIAIAPDYAPAYYYRAILFYTQGPREQAIADFSRYLELAPDGIFAADAATYIEDIEAQLAALDG